MYLYWTGPFYSFTNNESKVRNSVIWNVTCMFGSVFCNLHGCVCDGTEVASSDMLHVGKYKLCSSRGIGSHN